MKKKRERERAREKDRVKKEESHSENTLYATNEKEIWYIEYHYVPK